MVPGYGEQDINLQTIVEILGRKSLDFTGIKANKKYVVFWEYCNSRRKSNVGIISCVDLRKKDKTDL